MSDEIETIEFYRGVGIEDCQGRDRIESVVKPAIDEVFAIAATGELLSYCRDITRPPEARRFAAAKLEAGFEVAAADRVARPGIDVALVRAAVAGLGSRRWRCPSSYCSLLDVPPGPGQPKPQARAPEHRQQVENDRRRVAEEEWA